MFENFDFSLLDDPDFKEDAVREEIIVPVLKRLGYQASGTTRIQRSKALRHPFVHIGTRKHPVNIVPDYTLWHDDKPILILEAKKPSEEILHSQHVEQAYSYAIHPEIRCKHFALCNGKQIAIFHVAETAPLLVLSIRDLDKRWSDLEKYLTPRYLLNPLLRDFQPDLGVLATRIGQEENTDIVFVGYRLDLVAKVSDELYTASSCNSEEDPYLASFDFAPPHLESMLACLAWPLATQVRRALSNAPYQASLDLMLEIDCVTRLGVLTKGLHESFVPFVVTEIIESRFNRTPLDHEPIDIPEHIFRLRRAFHSLQESRH